MENNKITMNRAVELFGLQQKQLVLEWIQLEPRLYQPSQTIDPTPQVRILAGQVYRASTLVLQKKLCKSRQAIVKETGANQGGARTGRSQA